MSVCLFIGPTLTAQDARALCPDALCLPPVRQGDVYRIATSLRPDAIGIVDGYFAHVPSVWHKEILHAITEGVPVYGAASMGALRAAELAQFGMVGIGRIFEAYRNGVLAPYDEPFEDDDEVAVLHGPAELGYLALSDALVNIRCTLARAAEERIIDLRTRDALIRLGKALFYQERSYEAILSRAEGSVPANEVEGLRAWLPGGKVDQKRADAQAMLHALRAADRAHPDARYTLAETTLWARAKAGVDAEGTVAAPELEELRLQPASYRAARARALDRLLEPERPEHDGQEAHDPPEGGERHIHASLAAAARARRRDLLAAQVPGPLLERHILAELRASGEDRTLRRRAEEKRRRLAQIQSARPVPSEQLVAWYFRERGAAVPADLEAYSRQLDFPSLDAFHRSLLDEYLFGLFARRSEVALRDARRSGAAALSSGDRDVD
jgi:hypothetical protein